MLGQGLVFKNMTNYVAYNFPTLVPTAAGFGRLFAAFQAPLPSLIKVPSHTWPYLPSSPALMSVWV